MNPKRRTLLKGLAVGGAAVGLGGVGLGHLQAVGARRGADGAFVPGTTDQLAAWLRGTSGAVAIRGAGYSMGGQTQAGGGAQIDMRRMNRVVGFDGAAKTIRVQAGITWRALLDHIDPKNLSVAIMQSYSNFSVGGSLSVNCHGRYVGAGPVVNSVRAIQLLTADGKLHELRPGDPLFAGAIGGYGLVGVITEVELGLVDNTRIQRETRRVALADYPDFFAESIQGRAVLHNADLMPPHFDAPVAITWRRTEDQATIGVRLIARDQDYTTEQWELLAVSELASGPSLRQRYETEPLERAGRVVCWRNHEASLDARSLDPVRPALSEYLLQEYFIPVGAFHSFAREMQRTFARYEPNVLNISIRHSPADTSTLLPWAKQEVFSFVVYHKQRLWAGDSSARGWSQRLIDAALDHGGRHYLPYRLHATKNQVERGYPGLDAMKQLRAVHDPQRRMTNRMWQAYGV